MKKVVILGCGPAGLIAAHAAATAGVDDIRILSKSRKSRMNGAQYLHEPIPLATPPDSQFLVSYQLTGGVDGYRRKVYGPRSEEQVSPESLTGTHPAWDIRSTYDRLWGAYGRFIKEYDVRHKAVGELVDDHKPDLVVSSVPAHLLCNGEHAFSYTTINSSDRLMMPLDDNTVLCNGAENPSWYRQSRIQGWENTEWPAAVKPPITPMWEVVKPTKTNCNCHPNVLRVGRYGRWQKGVLSHEAWSEVMQACSIL